MWDVSQSAAPWSTLAQNGDGSFCPVDNRNLKPYRHYKRAENDFFWRIPLRNSTAEAFNPSATVDGELEYPASRPTSSAARGRDHAAAP